MVGIILCSGLLLVLAYRFYGAYVSRIFQLDDTRPTPAHRLRDDVDYMPTPMPVLLGHHFASIAGAGPIVGPIIAVAFGWVPALAWILVGAIFFGAVHDLGSMIASLRNDGKSIGEVISRNIGPTGRTLFLVFALATLLLIIAVFMDIVARTFVGNPAAASASLAFIGLAVLFGLANKRLLLPFWLLTLVGVGAMYAMIEVGLAYPLELPYPTWIGGLVLYCFCAAVLPVWALLQPRDYLNSFLLYGMMLLGIAGILFVHPEIRMSTAVHLTDPKLGTIFPVLFVTIACGAISGFHSMVAAGTTSKQINRESDARRVGFGGMLIESMLAVIAVCTVIVMERADYTAQLAKAGPVSLYSQGLGSFISGLGIPEDWAVSFVALTVSAFAVTTLDTCTRLARFVLQELFQDTEGRAPRAIVGNRYSATAIVALLGTALLATGQFQELWPIFGSANTLLAALALLAITVWLHRSGRSIRITLVPMIFMFLVTLTSLASLTYHKVKGGDWALAAIGALLFVLSVVLVLFARNSLSKARI